MKFRFSPRYQLPSRNPLHVFPGQNEDEPVEIFVRIHPVFNWATLLKYLMYLLLPGLFLMVLVAFGARASGGAVRLVLLLYCFYALLGTAAFFVLWMKVYLDYTIVTRIRVVDVDVHKVFSVYSAETLLSEIVDVSVWSKGFLARKLRYGTIEMQTAAQKGRFEQRNIPDAEEVRTRIMSLREEHDKKSQAEAFRAAFRAMGEVGIPVRAADEKGIMVQSGEDALPGNPEGEQPTAERRIDDVLPPDGEEQRGKKRRAKRDRRKRA